MSEPERPLHVRVAEALGWSLSSDGASWISPSGGRYAAASDAVPPRYDRDWEEAGPLIERFGFSLEHPELDCDKPSQHDCLMWKAHPRGVSEVVAAAGTPLDAVCHLILALSEAGKLPR